MDKEGKYARCLNKEKRGGKQKRREKRMKGENEDREKENRQKNRS